MPLFDNNLLDDQPTFDATPDFRGGMDTTVTPHLLAQNQYAYANNMQLTHSGRPETRHGFEVVGDMSPAVQVRSMGYYHTPSDELLVTTADNQCRVWDNATLTNISGYDLTGDVTSFQAEDKFLFCGAAKLLEYDGTDIYKVTRLTVSIDTAGTGYSVGDALTFTGGSPTENAVGEVASVDSSNGITGITITNRGRGFTSAPTVGVTSAGSGAVLTAALVDPPTGTIGVWFTKRAFLAGDSANPTRLHISDILDPGYWADANSIDIGADGDPITGLFPWDNYNLLVFKANSTYLVTADPTTSPANWVVQQVSSTIGCAAHNTAVQVGADVWWLSHQGVVSVKRLNQETQREVTLTISLPIQSTIDRINWSAVSDARAKFFDNKFLLSLPLDSATTNNTLVVFDTYHQVWVSEWSNINATSFGVTRFSDERTLYVGDSSGQVREYSEALTADRDGGVDTEIPSELKLRAFQFSEPVSPKSLLNVELEFQGSTATIDLSVFIDEGSEQSLVSDLTTFRELLTLPFTLPATLSDGGHYRRAFNLLKFRRIRQVQPRITSDSGTLSLRSVVFSAFIETMLLEQ